MNEIEKKKLHQIYQEYSDHGLIEAALSPQEDYDEGVYDLIMEISKERGIAEHIYQSKDRINQKKQEKELIDSMGPCDFNVLTTIQAKITNLSDEALIEALNHEKEETIQEIIQEELYKRGIEEPHLLKEQYSQVQTIKINPFKIMKDGFQIVFFNSDLLFLGIIILIPDILLGFNRNLRLLSAFIIQSFVSGLIIKYINEIKTVHFSWKTIIKFVLNKYIFLITACLIYFFLFFLGLVLYIIPGIFVGIKMILFNQAIILENKGIIESLKRSWEITTGNFWALLTIGVTFFVPIIIFSKLQYQFPYSISIIFQAGMDAFFTLWMCSVYTLVYLKLIRNEKPEEDIAFHAQSKSVNGCSPTPEKCLVLTKGIKVAAIYFIIAGGFGILWFLAGFGPHFQPFQAKPFAHNLISYTRETVINVIFVISGIFLLYRKLWARKMALVILVISLIHMSNSFAWGFANGPPSLIIRLISFLIIGLWNGIWFYLIFRVKPIEILQKNA